MKEVITMKGRRVVGLDGGEGLWNNCASLGRGNVVIYTGDSYIYSCFTFTLNYMFMICGLFCAFHQRKYFFKGYI